MLKYKFFISLICLFSFLKMHAQDTANFSSLPGKRGDFAMVLYASGGVGYFASHKGTPAYLNPTSQRLNSEATLRIMWFPDHLLKVGLESGLVNFYKYSLKDSAGNKGKISLSAVPLLLEWSMSLTKHFNIFAGSGAYLLRTNLDYASHSTATKLSVGWMAAASYIFPISKNTGLGTEAKWLYAAETSNGVFCFQVQYVWKFLKW